MRNLIGQGVSMFRFMRKSSTSTDKIRSQLSLFLLAASLVACSQSGEARPPLADLQISIGSAEADENGKLPVILPGSPDFHATDPASVVIVSGRVQFIEFFAYWCSVCKAMAPTVHGLEILYSGQVNFIYLDRDDPATLPLQEMLGYIYQPHFFLIDDDGKLLGEWRGYVEGETLQAALVEATE